MPKSAISYGFSEEKREKQAENLLVHFFSENGWQVRVDPQPKPAPHSDLQIRKAGSHYQVEVKAASEGRVDRLIPLWSQAFLESAGKSSSASQRLVVMVAPRIAEKAAEQILKFAEIYAPEAAAGVFDFAGLRRFRGAGLEGLDADHNSAQLSAAAAPAPPVNLFSDLNQWMLKVLLAPELPPNLLSAPRAKYRNAVELSEAAEVTNVSAHRFLHALRADGYLDESARHLNLVRRAELFQKWQAAVAQRAVERPMRFLLGGNSDGALAEVVKHFHACLGLFAAADALHLGFVKGVPPHVYVSKFDEAGVSPMSNVRKAEKWEAPDFVLRKAKSAQSIFRGSVAVNGIRVSDVIQIWLDVSSHPSRGAEQAELICRRVLNAVINGDRHNG